jgi:hypothetical protein
VVVERARWHVHFHKGEFFPAVSSIKIIDKKQAPGFEVFLSEISEGETIACDGCRDFYVPLCVEYCTKKDDLQSILKAFILKITSK